MPYIPRIRHHTYRRFFPDTSSQGSDSRTESSSTLSETLHAGSISNPNSDHAFADAMQAIVPISTPQYDLVDRTSYYTNYKRQRGINGAIPILVAHAQPITVPEPDPPYPPNLPNIFSVFHTFPLSTRILLFMPIQWWTKKMIPLHSLKC
jgi:hypothetical protein